MSYSEFFFAIGCLLTWILFFDWFLRRRHRKDRNNYN